LEKTRVVIERQRIFDRVAEMLSLRCYSTIRENWRRERYPYLHTGEKILVVRNGEVSTKLTGNKCVKCCYRNALNSQ
jgi:hypothetical protein